jgi:hypothetical protein
LMNSCQLTKIKNKKNKIMVMATMLWKIEIVKEVNFFIVRILVHKVVECWVSMDFGPSKFFFENPFCFSSVPKFLKLNFETWDWPESQNFWGHLFWTRWPKFFTCSKGTWCQYISPCYRQG